MKAAAWVLVALLLSGAALVGVELGKGALDEPAPKIANPCQPREGRTGGIDATIQRIVLDGLDGAAHDSALAAVRDRLAGAIAATITRASRPAFFLCAGFAALALLLAAAFRRQVVR